MKEFNVTETRMQERMTAAAGPEYFIAETAENIYPACAPISTELKRTGPGTPQTRLDARSVFFLGLLLAGSGFISPPVALVGGIASGFTIVHPYRTEASSLAKLLL